ncbi:MAG: PorT family protein [candidate division KSB1 bacterium]|nr:PorT family protein [candidate division KSB1 bacterium]MDZ7295098.1 PorT family protein [candidate division KSB1 bacterium]MDZ7378361.1 PorT family protein [candidate division KSB1 bacterium]MDZ7386531.1 PorT family protein [candidate division KSB1 bacterium]MDZ7391364.1 PorT family protein [candidate division KSB1 bacterium]
MRWSGLIVALALCLPGVTTGQSGFSIKSGWNLSTFVDQDHGLKPGVVLAVEKEWALFENVSLSLEVAYVTRGGILRDKVVGSHFPATSRWWRSQVCSMGFVEFPLLARYQIKRSGRRQWQVTGGVALAVAVNDNSEVLRSTEIPNSYDPVTGDPTVRSDYGWWDGCDLYSPAADNSSFVGHVGVGCKQGHYHIELRYTFPFAGLQSAGGVALEGKRYHSLAVTLGVWLPKRGAHGTKTRD